MPSQVSALSGAQYLRTATAIIDDVDSLSDSTVRLIQLATGLPPVNDANLEAVGKRLRHGRDRCKTSVRELRATGRHHTRKRGVPGGPFGSQVLLSQVPLLTPEEVDAGWKAAEEALTAGHDTPASLALGVRILNSAMWLKATLGR